MSTPVRIEKVTKRFGKYVANDNVNLDIKAGDFVSLLGPSGCGKTTLLSMILGIQDITEGNIYFGDEAVQDIPIHKRDVGMVFQNYALFPHMTVEDNVAFGLKMRKTPKDKMGNLVHNALSMVHLEHLKERFPRELSGGQQQRVAFARAIVVKPRVLLLDEPLSNLDAKLREEMRFELKKLHNLLGITTIYVTHDQIEALSLSTKIAVMKNGIVQQDGTPLDIFLTPSNQFVAEFVGYANFLTGTVQNVSNGMVSFKDDTYGYMLEADASKQMYSADVKKGDKVVATIKPENVFIFEQGENKEGTNNFKVKVGMNDYTGSATRYELITDSGFVIKGSVSGYSNYPLDSETCVHFKKEHITLIKI